MDSKHTEEHKDSPPSYCVIDPNSNIPRNEFIPNKPVFCSEKEKKTTEPVVHYVKKGDTLSGLAIKYQVDKGYIRSLNRLTTDEVACYQTLRIPTSLLNKAEIPDLSFLEAKRQERLISRFRCKTKCQDTKEARIYLEDNLFDLDQAIIAFNQDLEWEKSHPMPNNFASCSSKKPKSFLGFIYN